MIKKTITYVDYNDQERTEDFYFNLSRAEVTELEFSMPGGFRAHAEKIAQAEDAPKLMSLFKDLVMMSYGEKSPDGKRFIKSRELSEAFVQTEAYSELVVELMTDGDAAIAFFNGIAPKVVPAKPN